MLSGRSIVIPSFPLKFSLFPGDDMGRSDIMLSGVAIGELSISSESPPTHVPQSTGDQAKWVKNYPKPDNKVG